MQWYNLQHVQQSHIDAEIISQPSNILLIGPNTELSSKFRRIIIGLLDVIQQDKNNYTEHSLFFLFCFQRGLHKWLNGFDWQNRTQFIIKYSDISVTPELDV